MPFNGLLLFDFPESRFSKAKTFLKVFAKEGILQGSWVTVFRNRRIGGSVTIPKNLVRGLSQIGSDFTVNSFFQTPYDVAFVLKNCHALRWAIEAKKRGLLKKLVAGPFISNFPRENREILLSKEIDGLLFLCNWHRNLFLEHFPGKPPHHFIWFSGIDTDYWSSIRKEKRHILIFLKRKPPPIFNFVEDHLRKNGFSYKIIIYGHYTPEEYRFLLAEAKCTIFFVPSETQGLTMFESWSMNVPTLHWEQNRLDYFGSIYENASSCPYLSPSSGHTFGSEKQFLEVFDHMRANYPNYRPRDYVVDRFTLNHSAQRFIQISEAILETHVS